MVQAPFDVKICIEEHDLRVLIQTQHSILRKDFTEAAVRPQIAEEDFRSFDVFSLYDLGEEARSCGDIQNGPWHIGCVQQDARMQTKVSDQ